VKTGSLEEADDQQGLAHLIEHMAFNGSAHFKPGELVSYFERLGARQDGILRSHQVAPNGTLRDTVVYSITAAEWPTVQTHLNYQLNDKPR